jgi:glyoxylase-like metal-dependent hydrolase (beta-lactamase superfamily II)
MISIATTGTDLHWEVLTIKRPGLTRDLPPGKEGLMWVANSSTLICGERDAILVDTFLTTEQSKTLLGWVVARGKNLTAIYITHGHGDHFFGLASLLERFPEPRRSRPPRSSRRCASISRRSRSRTFGGVFFPGRFRTVFWLPSRLKETLWSWRGTSSSQETRGEPILPTPHACMSRRLD